MAFESDFSIIRDIIITGNEKTKSAIIIRELDIDIGDTLHALNVIELIEKDRNKIINLNLFLKVELQVVDCEAPFSELHIYLAEQFYFLPTPIFRLADRSFNEWWYNRNRDLNRVIYGLNLIHFNVGGRADEFLINLENGFAKQIAFIYKMRNIDKQMKTGLEVNFFNNTSRQISYRTNNDKQVFAQNDENILLKKFFTRIIFKRRNNFYERQRLDIGYFKDILNDSVASLNRNYFLNGNTQLKYMRLAYSFEGDHRDNILYPSKGHYFIGKFTRLGLLKSDNINQNELYLSYAYYMDFGKKWFGDFNFRTKITGPSLQPFATSTAFGYKTDNIRGYDLYVIDGQKFGLFKSNIRRQIFESTMKIPNWGPWKAAQDLPIAIYARAFFDMGYVQNKFSEFNNSKLSNKALSGFGLGVDIVSIYSTALKASYSANNLGEKGLYFAFGKEF